MSQVRKGKVLIFNFGITTMDNIKFKQTHDSLTSFPRVDCFLSFIPI